MLRSLMLALVVLVGTAGQARAQMPDALMYKNPQCGCCEGYAKYLRGHGFKVSVKETHNMSLISQKNGVPEKLAGCHTMLIGGYVVEGHVPVSAIDKLLKGAAQHQGHSPRCPACRTARPACTGKEDRAIHDLRGFGRGQGVHGGVTHPL